jgi:hypothetical protein
MQPKSTVHATRQRVTKMTFLPFTRTPVHRPDQYNFGVGATNSGNDKKAWRVKGSRKCRWARHRRLSARSMSDRVLAFWFDSEDEDRWVVAGDTLEFRPHILAPYSEVA